MMLIWCIIGIISGGEKRGMDIKIPVGVYTERHEYSSWSWGAAGFLDRDTLRDLLFVKSGSGVLIFKVRTVCLSY